MIKIYTDGACRGNPGPGGWGVLILENDTEKTLSGYAEHTTNNQMELTAAIKALKNYTKSSNIELYTDSKYVKDGISSWIFNWKKNGWKNAQKKPVKNSELWQELDNLNNFHNVTWHWVKGHSNHPLNDRADLLANQAIDKLLTKA